MNIYIEHTFPRPSQLYKGQIPKSPPNHLENITDFIDPNASLTQQQINPLNPSSVLYGMKDANPAGSPMAFSNTALKVTIVSQNE